MKRVVRVRDGRARGLASLFVFARAEWRVRWRSHVVVAGLAAAAVAATVATLTASARSETAFHRLRAATNASDAILFDPTTQRPPAEAVAAVDAIAGVKDAGAEAELFVRPAGTDYFPDYNLYPVAPLGPQSAHAMDVALITKGRPVDAGRFDEIAVSEKLAADLGVGVGDRITLESMTAKWVDAANNGGDPGRPDGPRVRVEVVGLTRTPADFGRLKGLLYLSRAFVERYGGQLNVHAGVAARLSEEALRQARRGTLSGLAGAEVDPSPFGDDAATDDGLGTIATALRLVAAAVALAGAIATALALLRLSLLALRDRATLVALGWTKTQLMSAAVVVSAPWMAMGIAVGLLAGVFTSPLALVGLARRVDPTPRSVVLDTGLVLGALAGSIVVGLITIALAAQRAASPQAERARPAVRALPLRRPLALVLGVRYALFGETARGGRTSRGALAVVAAGVVGVVAALSVSASIARLQTDPSLTGQGTSRVIDSGKSMDVYDRALPLLEKDDRVAMLAGIQVSFSISAVGAGSQSAVGAGDLTALAYDIRRGELGASVVRGRIAHQPDEVALGPATLDHLGKDVGDRIELRGTGRTAEFHIVGSVLFPEGDFAHDDGVALTASGADRLLGNVHDTDALYQVAFRWARGVDAHAADQELSAAGLQVLTNEDALKPAAVNNLGDVEVLPRYLAAFVGLLCLVTLGHALVVSVRLRTRELGTLRTLGMTPRASGAIFGAHALTIVGVAVAVGVPVGLRAGERVWTPIANRAHVVVRTVAPWSWIEVLLFVAVATTGVLTAVPAWRALRLRPADTLRAE